MQVNISENVTLTVIHIQAASSKNSFCGAGMSGGCSLYHGSSEIGKLNNDVIRIDRDKPQSLLDQTSRRRVNLPSTTALDATQ